MNYALDQFTMTDGEVLIVQGANSLYTYQNTGNSPALIQGSNDTTHWTDIAQIAVGNSLVKEHSYKYLRLLGNTTVAVNRGEGDNTIAGSNSGGTADYPSFTGNANKVLAVKATEDGVEWKAVSSGGGSGGGINVIEYHPSLYEVITHTVDNSDLIPTPVSAVNTTNSASWDTTTGVMGIANPSGVISSYSGRYTQHVGLKLPLSMVGMRGSFTINASQCQDAWGIGLLSESTDVLALTNGIEDLDLFLYLEQQHYKYQPYTGLNISTPQTFGMFNNESSNVYTPYQWVTAPFSVEYQRQTSSNIEGKPQGVYTFTVGNIINVYMALTGLTAEQSLSLLQSNLLENSLNLALSKTFLFCSQLKALLEIKADTPFLHLFMTAYHLETDPTGTYELDPTSELTLTLNLQQVANAVPTEAVDGDFLHLLGNAKMFGKDLASGDFVQLYDNTSKMIVHANQP